VAHGSRDPRAARTVEELMAGVRARAAVRETSSIPVLTAYLDHACPSPGQVLTGLAEAGHDTVVVLPLLLTAAYHSKIDLPEVLRGVRQSHPRLAVRYGSTLGPDPLLRDAVLRRLGESGVSPAPGTAVVLTSAGSSDPAAARTIERLAASLHDGGPAGTGWHSVLPAYASAAEPDPATAVAMARSAGARRVVVAPYLLAPGHFADQVRERTLAAGADVVAPVLGPAPELAEIVLRRYDEALDRRLVAAAAG
jgi:sirohydrochlorin ferrochelatase